MDNITVGGVTLHSPLLNAAGTMGFGSSYADYIDLHRLGGLVTRTMTVKPRRGAEAPRLWETPSGLLNCVGMQNPGYEKFTQVFYKGLVGYDVPIIASVTGTPEEIRRMADALAELPAVAGVEVNLHCTYEEYRTLGSKAYLEQCAQRIRAAADGRLPVWAKLSPCAGDIVDAARPADRRHSPLRRTPRDRCCPRGTFASLFHPQCAAELPSYCRRHLSLRSIS